ncbi:UDP-3-O-(3-hydroxymyristoyl)glucosamine N-acyltransferase [Halothiobacillus sp. DCM-1]|uniref:UDP-3-O-(3-hydroxymyristoyl)glucosamine N-acyltransferase n=1 Tax=Halothiobacillus sp. DCM-1 TaxID=3112558 RepID=UPI00324D9B0A
MPRPASFPLTVAALAERLGAVVAGGCAERILLGVASLRSATSTDLSFFSGARRGIQPENTRAGAVLCRAEDADRLPADTARLIVEKPQSAFVLAAQWMYPPAARTPPGIDPSARIHPSAQLGEQVTVGAYAIIGADCVIGERAVIGAGSVLGERVEIGAQTELIARVTVLEDCSLGARCLVQPGVVIGSDGFGLVNESGRWQRVPQLGRVRIGDDVDIGANTTIDRGALDDTLIADGVKIDNLVQIAHNVEIGAHSAIAGCAGLAGSSIVGRHCTLGGGVGLAGHLSLADGVHVTGMSMVTRSIHQAGIYSAGTPLDTNERWHKNAARFKQLDRMAQRLAALEARLADSLYSDVPEAP